MRRELEALAIAAHGYWVPSRTDATSGRRSRAGRKLSAPGEWWKTTTARDLDTEPPHKRARTKPNSIRHNHQPTKQKKSKDILNVEGKELSGLNNTSFSSPQSVSGACEIEDNESRAPRVQSAHPTSPTTPALEDEIEEEELRKPTDSAGTQETPSNSVQQNATLNRRRKKKRLSVLSENPLSPTTAGKTNEPSRGDDATVKQKQKRLQVVARKPNGKRKLFSFSKKMGKRQLKRQENKNEVDDTCSESRNARLRVPRTKPLGEIELEEGVSITTGSDDVNVE